MAVAVAVAVETFREVVPSHSKARRVIATSKYNTIPRGPTRATVAPESTTCTVRYIHTHVSRPLASFESRRSRPQPLQACLHQQPTGSPSTGTETQFPIPRAGDFGGRALPTHTNPPVEISEQQRHQLACGKPRGGGNTPTRTGVARSISEPRPPPSAPTPPSS